MKPNQRRLNEFLVDLVEFVEKHFQIKKNRTRIREEDGCASIIVMHEAAGSEVEINTSGAEVAFRFGGAEWKIEGGADVGDLYLRILRDFVDILRDRKTVWRGYRNGDLLGCQVSDSAGEAESALGFVEKHAGCDRLTCKRWSLAEGEYPLKNLEQ